MRPHVRWNVKFGGAPPRVPRGPKNGPQSPRGKRILLEFRAFFPKGNPGKRSNFQARKLKSPQLRTLKETRTKWWNKVKLNMTILGVTVLGEKGYEGPI